MDGVPLALVKFFVLSSGVMGAIGGGTLGKTKDSVKHGDINCRGYGIITALPYTS